MHHQTAPQGLSPEDPLPPARSELLDKQWTIRQSAGGGQAAATWGWCVRGLGGVWMAHRDLAAGGEVRGKVSTRLRLQVAGPGSRQ